MSCPTARFGALSQSEFPAVSTTRLPSLPSNVLGETVPLDPATNTTANNAAAANVSPRYHQRRVRRSRKRTAAITTLRFRIQVFGPTRTAVLTPASETRL